MRESELLSHIARRSADLAGFASAMGDLVVGPGDDAAVVRLPDGAGLLITVDQLVVGRHVEPGAAIDLIARKAIARSVSDIAAMGGVPAWGLATGLLPSGYDHVNDLFDAMARWARHWNCPLIGGDIASGSDTPSITVTIAGTMHAGHRPVLRSGARPGDRLWLTGPIGGSLASGRHATFEPRLPAGQKAAAIGAHAMLDVSDGLGRDAARLGEASGVMLVLDASEVPVHEGAGDWQEAFAAGEDYELLIAAPPSLDAAAKSAGWLGPVGEVRAGRAQAGGSGAVIVDESGTERDAAELGWDH